MKRINELKVAFERGQVKACSRSRSDKQRTPAAHCRENIVAVGSNRVEQTSRIKGHSKAIPIQYDPLKIIQIFPPFHLKSFDLKLQESRQLYTTIRPTKMRSF